MLHRKNKLTGITFILIVILNISASCGSAKYRKNKYDNPDITSIYSTNSLRPYKYGFPYTSEECEIYFRDAFTAYGITKGDVVADIGAASGWLDGVFSVLSDEVTYYIQDIDTNILNQEEFDKVVSYYSKEKSTPQTNKFYFVIGSESSTNLPDNYFTKVIINNTFHEIDNIDTLIQDMDRKLMKGGKIIIHENFSTEKKKIHHGGCDIKAYTVQEVEEIMLKKGYYLTATNAPLSAVENYLTFEKNKNTSEEFKYRLKDIEIYLDTLISLHDIKFCKDEKLVENLTEFIEKGKDSIESEFPAFRDYFSTLGQYYDMDGKYSSAINVLKINRHLYPDDINVYKELGDMQLENYRIEDAKNSFNEALQIDSFDYEAYFGLARTFQAERDYFEAELQLLKAIEYNLNESEYYALLGSLKEVTFEFEEALDNYSKAIEFNSLDPEYYISRGKIYSQLGSTDEAIADFNKALELNPFNWTVYKYRAEIYEEIGEKSAYKKDKKRMKNLRMRARRLRIRYKKS